jgi:hypothetical protein
MGLAQRNIAPSLGAAAGPAPNRACEAHQAARPNTNPRPLRLVLTGCCYSGRRAARVHAMPPPRSILSLAAVH